MTRRIRTNTTYVYNPVPLDRCNPPYGAQTGILVPGSLVRAVRLPGCPSPNTMGHTHIALHPSGAFAGLVCTNSLLTPKEFAALWAICADGGRLCSNCVQTQSPRIADVDPTCPDDDQWRIIGYQTPDPDHPCDHCHTHPQPSTR